MIGNGKQHLSSKESTTMGPRANHRHFPQPPSCHCGCRSHLQVPAPPVDVDQDPATRWVILTKRSKQTMCTTWHYICSVALMVYDGLCLIFVSYFLGTFWPLSIEIWVAACRRRRSVAAASCTCHTCLENLDGLIWNRKTDQDMPFMIINHGIHGANK